MRLLISTVIAAALSATLAFADPLPSWEPGASKTAILDFVATVTDPASDDFVPVEDRIATFDNDGTLWAEQPVYFQLLFAINRLQAMAKDDPSILKDDVLTAAAKGDMKALAASGEKGLLEVIGATHSGLSVDEFKTYAREFLTTQKHPEKDMLYIDMTYQPMIELLTYLRDQGFSTYIVSGGGIDFMRSITQTAYNIPTQQVIGSSSKSTYTVAGDKPVIMKEPGILFIDDKTGKPVGIESHIGKRPILAVGNSDGDYQMLQWTTSGDGKRLGMIVHHTDAAREWAYDRDSHVGTLNKAMDDAPKFGWVLIDMKDDWSRIWSGGNE
ncbi:HAD family hydrolase [Chachezhania sediminis]|uniref:HAD family hydrolase n=1 Tax=Chachezhania sediminis TaxID=2599291 RepID=UPI00131C9A9A|nr:HAD family hydrolase [Chachezhania sediminis]